VVISCWSAKGGCGTTVVACALAILQARVSGEALLVDLAGDAPAALGVPEPTGPGIAQWLAAAEAGEASAEALPRLEVEVGSGIALIPRGEGDLAGTTDDLLGAWTAGSRPVVVDCGTLDAGATTVAAEIAATASRSLLVVRPCFLAVRRALAAPVGPSGVVLVHEPGRGISRTDVETVLGAPVVAEVDLDPAIGRAVDAGLLSVRLPRELERSLRRAA
jgi:hypothetical protein